MTPTLPDPIFFETERLYLKPFCHDDAPAIFDYASNPAVTPYTTWDTHQSIEDAHNYLAWTETQAKNQPIGILGLFLKSAPKNAIGAVSILIAKNGFEAELAYVLGKNYWGKGLMQEAARCLIGHTRQLPNIKRLFATCMKENKASSTLLKRLGLSYEGCLKCKEFRKGRFWDIESYSLIFD